MVPLPVSVAGRGARPGPRREGRGGRAPFGSAGRAERGRGAESAVLAADPEAVDPDPDAGEGYYRHVLRAYAVDVPRFAGRTVGSFEAEQKAAGRRLYITRLRRAGEILEHDPDTRIELGDTRSQLRARSA